MVANNRIIFFMHLILFMAKSTIETVLNDFCHEIKAIFCIFIKRNMISITYFLI
jgi:hypothetical protein